MISNNCGTTDHGLGVLLKDRQIRKMISSYVGENKVFEEQYLSGELEVELNPQGTLAERIRAGGAGIPAFYTPTGYGTWISEGKLPVRFHQDGSVAQSNEAKETRSFEDRDYVLETWLRADFALVKAQRGDTQGNLVFHATARNFNPLMAMAGTITIAEVEELVEPGGLEPDEIHTPGIFVQRILVGEHYEKWIEQRTTRARA